MRLQSFLDLRRATCSVLCFTHGLSSRWLFVSHTVPSDGAVFQPLEDVIHQEFIPALTGCSPPSDSVYQLFALPARWGWPGCFCSYKWLC